jgi:uncharacterized protein (DUF362 family)
MGRGLALSDSTQSKVAIVKGHPVNKNLAKALDLIGGLQTIIHPHSRVLIKPNLGVALPAKTAVTTDPRIVTALIHLLRDAGAKKVLVGESAVVGFDAGEIFTALKLKGPFEKAGAEVVNLDQDEWIEVKVPKGEVLKKINVCRTAYESDLIITVPKMKTHFQTGVTLGLKNMKGTIPDVSKRIMHRIGVPLKKREEFGLDRAIVDLSTVLSPDLSIIDALIALEGFVPGPRLVGTPIRMNTLIAGFDPVAVDAVSCRVMGLNPLEIRHLRLAHERQLGRILPEEIEIVGRSLESVVHPMRVEPSETVQDAENILIIEGRGCSGCSVTNRLALSFFSPQDLKKLGDITLVVGDAGSMAYQPRGRCFFVGNCAARSRKGKEGVPIEGCPPPGIWIRQVLTHGIKNHSPQRAQRSQRN